MSLIWLQNVDRIYIYYVLEFCTMHFWPFDMSFPAPPFGASQNVDRIYVLSDGVVAEQGTHAQLMAGGCGCCRLGTVGLVVACTPCRRAGRTTTVTSGLAGASTLQCPSGVAPTQCKCCLFPSAARGVYYDMWRMQRAQAVLEEHLAAEEAQHRQQGSSSDAASSSSTLSRGGSSSEEEGLPATLREAGRRG